ncbi:alpha-2-macroglobulin family protein [Oleidesulfovibrio sp.]|uniref:alpha-2-macroglobulin family protein n=1 Tax=Oleidesulfovibrio sp. TaxID=2909707 RepID=UPI003A8BAA7D
MRLTFRHRSASGSPFRFTILLLLLSALLMVAGCDQSAEDKASDTKQSAATDQNASTPAQPAGSGSASSPTQEEAALPFGYKSYSIIEAQNGPEICLDFTQALDESGTTAYQDYILTESRLTVSRVQAQRLCLTGAKAGDSVSLTLRAGLPAVSQETLPADEKIAVSLRNRKPSVNFERGFILPRGSAKGLPVSTVNTNECWIAVLRMPPHAITQVYNDSISGRRFNPWEIVQVNRWHANLVWNGTMQVASRPNETITTLFPVRDIATQGKAGLYFVLGSPEPLAPADGIFSYEDIPSEVAGQMLLETDLALTTYHGANGMTVAVRSYATAQPVADTTVTLISRNLEELGTITTGADGMAEFPAGLVRGKGAAEPVMLTATNGDDTALLDLRGTPLDLSDRGIEGRMPIHGVDAYLYTDRGVYRPRETVNLVTMLRDPRGKAVSDVPLTVTINRPDGKAYLRTTVQKQQDGSLHLPVQLSETALRGRWQATAHIDPKAPPVGEVFFQVEDFVPERLAVALHVEPERITPSTNATVNVQADFLYGAAGDGLTTEGDIILRPDPAPFGNAYAGYIFGNMQTRPIRMEQDIPATDADGKASLVLSLASLKKSAASQQNDYTMLLKQPARADVTVRVQEPGGRTTTVAVAVPVLAQQQYIGLRPLFRDGYAPVGQPTEFMAICTDAKGNPVALPDAQVTWKRIRVSWQWSRTDNGNWRYEHVERVVDTRTENVSLPAEGPQRFSRTLDWGKYLVEIRHPETDAVVAHEFYVGWGAETDDDRPDRLDVRLDRKGYTAGSTATLFVNTPVAGKASVVIANENIQKVISADIPAGGGEISIPVSKEWGAGAYALVTLHQPLESRKGRSPARAVGVAWISIDMGEHTLPVSIKAPQTIRPRTTVSLPVQVQGATSAYVTLAAVDEGILQLTRFVSPSPEKYFYAKRRLGITMRDDYGRLIEGEGVVGAIRQGGDIAGASGSLAAVPLRIVSLFSGVVPVDASGKADIQLTVPEFQGRLRLMAVAWDKNGVGSASSAMTVRDPLVADIILPRFLAPQDSVNATMLLHNVEAPAGTYEVSVSTSGTLDAMAATQKVTLQKGERVLLPVPLTATGIGQGSVTATVNGPSFTAKIERDITVRSGYGKVYLQTATTLDSGKTLTLKKLQLLQAMEEYGALDIADVLPGSLKTTVQVGGILGADVPTLLRWLDRYPYGCLEQTTSRAMPLLYMAETAQMTGAEDAAPVADRIREAIYRIADMQNADGSLNMWPGDSWRADPWTTVFAMDFLVRARLQGHSVPDAVLEGAKTYLTGVARRSAYGASPEAVAYSYRVLAQAGVLLTADMRYFHDNAPQLYSTGWANLGRAFDLVGDGPRATSSFAHATDIIKTGRKPAEDVRVAPYKWGKRNLAFVVASAAESGRIQLAAELLQRGGGFDRDAGKWSTTTQEAGWKLLAVHGLLKGSGATAAELNGTPLRVVDGVALASLPEGPFTGYTDPETMTAMIEHNLKNIGEGIAWVTTAFDFTPARPLPALARRGLSLKREYLTFEGKPVDLKTLRRNDRFIVRLTMSAQHSQRRQIVVNDLLPAGLEVESIVPQNGSAWSWLKPTTASMLQKQDDRVVAVYDFDRLPWDNARGAKPLVAAYVVRAVTAGSFTLPPVSAEDMYDPAFAVRSEAGTLTIAP